MFGESLDERAWRGRGLALRLGIFLGAYVALHLLAWTIAWVPPNLVPYWWPGSGLYLGVLLRAPRHAWPAIVASVAAVLLLLVIVGVPPQRPDDPVLEIARLVTSLGPPLIGAAVARRTVGRPITLLRLRDLAGFAAAIAIGGALGIAGLLAGLAAAPASGRTFEILPAFTGGILGGLVAAPLAIAIPRRCLRPPLPRVVEAAALLLLLGTAVWAAFDLPGIELAAARHLALRLGRLALASALFLCLTWAAIRFGPWGAGWASFLVTVLGTWFTYGGHGPFGIPGAHDTAERVTFAETFFGMTALGALFTAALAAERSRALERERLAIEIDLMAALARPLGERLRRIADAIVRSLACACEIRLGPEHVRAVDPEAPAASMPREILHVPIPAGHVPGELRLLARPELLVFDETEREAAAWIAGRLADIDTRAALERRVREEKRRAAKFSALVDAMFESAPIGVALLDRDVRYQRVNRALAAITGLPVEDHLGKRPSEIFGEAGRAFDEAFAASLRSGKAVVARPVALALRRGARTRWLTWTWFPVVPPGEPAYGVACFVVDETERVEAEGAIARLLDRAQEAVRIRDDFLSVASHELKTPLTPLVARLQALRRAMEREGVADPEQVDKALDALARLQRRIDNLLDASRVRAAALELAVEPIDLARLVRAVVREYRPRGDGHRLHVELPAQPVVIRGDARTVRRVIESLVDNAYKFSPAGGDVAISLRTEGGRAHLAVSDQGIGIPEADQAGIFNRFARASNVSVWAFGGLGLSLYLARTVAEQLGGRIWVESAPGSGATFHLELPLATDAEAERQHAP